MYLWAGFQKLLSIGGLAIAEEVKYLGIEGIPGDQELRS